jgi:hypothetical protein
MEEAVQMVSAGFALPVTFLEERQKQEVVRLAGQNSLVCYTLGPDYSVLSGCITNVRYYLVH